MSENSFQFTMQQYEKIEGESLIVMTEKEKRTGRERKESAQWHRESCPAASKLLAHCGRSVVD